MKPFSPATKATLKAADKIHGKMARAFLDSVEKLRAHIGAHEQAFALSLAHGNVEQATHVLSSASATTAFEPFRAIVETSVLAGGKLSEINVAEARTRKD